VWGTAPLRALRAQAPRRAAGSGSTARRALQLLLCEGGLSPAPDTAFGEVSGAQGVPRGRGAPGSRLAGGADAEAVWAVVRDVRCEHEDLAALDALVAGDVPREPVLAGGPWPSRSTGGQRGAARLLARAVLGATQGADRRGLELLGPDHDQRGSRYLRVDPDPQKMHLDRGKSRS